MDRALRLPFRDKVGPKCDCLHGPYHTLLSHSPGGVRLLINEQGQLKVEGEGPRRGSHDDLDDDQIKEIMAKE